MTGAIYLDSADPKAKFPAERLDLLVALASISAAALDKAREAVKSAGDKIGTTGKGIGPTYEDKVARRALRVYDLFVRSQTGSLLAGRTRDIMDLHEDTPISTIWRLTTRHFPIRGSTTLESMERVKIDADVGGVPTCAVRRSSWSWRMRASCWPCSSRAAW